MKIKRRPDLTHKSRDGKFMKKRDSNKGRGGSEISKPDTCLATNRHGKLGGSLGCERGMKEKKIQKKNGYKRHIRERREGVLWGIGGGRRVLRNVREMVDL